MKSTLQIQRGNPKVIITVTVILAVGVFGLFIWNNISANKAEEIAKPIESSLLQGEAIKKCSSGDAGAGWDNTQPHYNATFQISANKTKALELMNQAASKNGFKLTHASSVDRGYLPVADAYVDAWYFDMTSKKTDYEKASGAVYLAMSVNSNGSEKVCKGTTLQIDDTHSVITLEVKLPGHP